MSYSLDQEPLPSRRTGPAADAFRFSGEAIGPSRVASSRPWGMSTRAD